MDDIIAVAVELKSGETRYFLTWGRIQECVDPAPVEALVLKHCHNFALDGEPVRARLCYSLQEARESPYFHEGFFPFKQHKIPREKRRFSAWKKQMNKWMRAGKWLIYCGSPKGHGCPDFSIASSRKAKRGSTK